MAAQWACAPQARGREQEWQGTDGAGPEASGQQLGRQQTCGPEKAHVPGESAQTQLGWGTRCSDRRALGTSPGVRPHLVLRPPAGRAVRRGPSVEKLPSQHPVPDPSRKRDVQTRPPWRMGSPGPHTAESVLGRNWTCSQQRTTPGKAASLQGNEEKQAARKTEEQGQDRAPRTAPLGNPKQESRSALAPRLVKKLHKNLEMRTSRKT